ncbi:MAG TPA: hypothetical protein V6D22_13820 [Candidatus Obscuribacterales bacterium]
MKRRLTYDEKLIIRKALERVYVTNMRAFLSEMSAEERAEAERLEQMFKECVIEVDED